MDILIVKIKCTLQFCLRARNLKSKSIGRCDAIANRYWSLHRGEHIGRRIFSRVVMIGTRTIRLFLLSSSAEFRKALFRLLVQDPLCGHIENAVHTQPLKESYPVRRGAEI